MTNKPEVELLRGRAEQARYDAVCDQEFATSYLMLAARLEAQADEIEAKP